MAHKTQKVQVEEFSCAVDKATNVQTLSGAGKAPEMLLRKPKVLEVTGLSNSTFYARIRDGSIKPGVPVGPRIKAWPASEIQSFIESCVAKRGTGVEQ